MKIIFESSEPIKSYISKIASNHFKEFTIEEEKTIDIIKTIVEIKASDFLNDMLSVYFSDADRLDLSKQDFVNDALDNCEYAIMVKAED